MTTTIDDVDTLEQDAEFDAPLRRVAYEAGMLLGIEATRDEQAYHRRRQNRQQYWLHGCGTLTGMAVSIDPATSTTPAQNELVRIIVSPGVGIDCFGRELLIHEPYCINLADWLEAQSDTELREGFSSADNLLTLHVYARHEDCAVAAQPVLARKLNLSTDAVQPSRFADSVMLDMAAELVPPADARYQPWANHDPVDDVLPAGLTQSEVDAITAAGTGNSGQQLRLHARLLHALDDSGVTTTSAIEDLQRSARLLLARISISVADIDNIIVNPTLISVNNLVRPFLTTPSQLALLARQA
jgi:hypothetical protein